MSVVSDLIKLCKRLASTIDGRLMTATVAFLQDVRTQKVLFGSEMTLMISVGDRLLSGLCTNINGTASCSVYRRFSSWLQFR